MENENQETREIFLGFGDPDEWRYFGETYEPFLSKKHYFFELMSRVFNRVVLEEAPLVDRIVFDLGLNCSQDFKEILLMCANGYGIGALKLLRSFYEKAVTAAYLSNHPDEAERFDNYVVIHMNKLFKEDPKFKEERREDAENVEENLPKVRADYQMTDCKKCGTKRDSISWSKLSLKDLAIRGKGKLEDLYTECYTKALFHSHPSMMGMLSRRRVLNQADSSTYFDDGPQRYEAGKVFLNSYSLMLMVLDRQIEHFNLDFKDELMDLLNDMDEIWRKKPA